MILLKKNYKKLTKNYLNIYLYLMSVILNHLFLYLFILLELQKKESQYYLILALINFFYRLMNLYLIIPLIRKKLLILYIQQRLML